MGRGTKFKPKETISKLQEVELARGKNTPKVRKQKRKRRVHSDEPPLLKRIVEVASHYTRGQRTVISLHGPGRRLHAFDYEA